MPDSPASDDSSAVTGEWTPLYRYGWLAWVWRPMIALVLTIAIAFAYGGLVFFPIVIALLVAALFWGAVVVVRADHLPDGRVQIWTLLFWRRRLPQRRLGPARWKKMYENDTGRIYAPRLWVRVSRSLPLYFDMQGHFPDRRTFDKVFRTPRRES